MLKFFRTIRKKLIEEDNVRKYLLYAIGEILLVVIGILIALQVNNWNEARKERNKEAYYISELIIDLEKNYVEAKTNSRFSKKQSSNASLLLMSIENQNRELKKSDWFSALMHTWFLPHPTYSSKTWNELNSTRELVLLRNKEVTRSISDYYDNIEHINVLEKEWGEFNLKYRYMVNSLVEPLLRDSVFTYLEFTGEGPGYSDAPDHTTYVNQLQNIDGVTGILSDIKINRTASAISHDNLLAANCKILGMLKQEYSLLK